MKTNEMTEPDTAGQTQPVVMDVPQHIEGVVRDFIAAHEEGKKPVFLVGCLLPNPFTDKTDYAFFDFEKREWRILSGDLTESP